MDFTSEQSTAIVQNGNLVVTAGAGSGKTRVLVERYLRLLVEQAAANGGRGVASHEPPSAIDVPGFGLPAPDSAPQALCAPDASDILAITFTEKAAREMRDRVRATVEQRARAAPPAERAIWEERRAAIEAARIGTIHSFCATLLRAHPAETGLDPRFVVLDEVEALLLLTESVDAALSAAVQPGAPNDAGIVVVFEEFGLDELRSILTGMLQGGAEVQATVLRLPNAPEGLLEHWRERLAAAQTAMLGELLASRRWCAACATLRSLAALARASDLIGRQVLEVVAWLEELGTGSGEIVTTGNFAPIKAINLKGGSKKHWPAEDDLKLAKRALETLRDTYKACADLLELVPDDDLERRAAQASVGLCALYGRAAEHYTRRKEQYDALDFNDLESYARTLLERYPAVRMRWQAELRAVLVDEFQDTNDEQRAIIYALTGFDDQMPPVRQRGESVSSVVSGLSPPALFVVGDGKQSIYRFRGADVSVFQHVTADIVRRGGQAVALDTSFRTHPPLLEWINRTVAPIFARERALHLYETPFETLQAYRSCPEHTRCVELHVVTEGDNASAARDAEARVVAARIQELVAGDTGSIVHDDQHGWRKPVYGDFALLFQASTVFEQYEQALREAGIPYLTTAGRGYYGRKEVQDLIHLLRVLDDPSDELALVGVLRSPLFALDDATILRLRFANPHSLWAALMQSEAPPAADQELSAADAADPLSIQNSKLTFHNSALAFARETLRDLHAMRGRVTVVELLRAALATTGYLATISGLPDGERRRVNVEKLLEAARRGGGLSAFSAYLDTLLKAEPREGEAPLEAEGSVRLMTVHRSKGLEFPIVVLPDLGRKHTSRYEAWLARRAYGLALQLRGSTSEWQKPVAYQLALEEERRMERAERERLLYVALTRARDYLLLSGPAAKKSGDDWLSRVAAALGWSWEDGGPPEGEYGPLRVWRYGE